MKVKRFATMMYSLGHEVYLYSGEENEASCTEHVTVVDAGDRAKWFPSYTPATDVWDGFQVGAEWWCEMNDRAETEIRKRAEPTDILCLIAGLCQKQIANAFPDMKAMEFGIGYEGSFSPYRVFESYAWMHHVAGLRHDDNVRFYDTVIPNSFEKSEFTFFTEPDDYLLYLGRMTPRKGLQIVEEIAKRGHRVITAGQGDWMVPSAEEHLGLVTGWEKKALIARAKAVLVPTTYLEPFGGVAVEAMLSGVPAITTDWGAFTETVHHGVTGFRCATLGEFLGAIEAVPFLDKHDIRDTARRRFLTDATAPQYDRYLSQLRELDGAGWYTEQGRLRSGIFTRH